MYIKKNPNNNKSQEVEAGSCQDISMLSLHHQTQQFVEVEKGDPIEGLW